MFNDLTKNIERFLKNFTFIFNIDPLGIDLLWSKVMYKPLYSWLKPCVWLSLKPIYEEKQVFDVRKFVHHEKGHVRMLIPQFQILNCDNDMVQKVVLWGPIMCFIYIYNILSLSGGGGPFHPSVSSSIHPSSSSRKKKMMEEDEVKWAQ
jgi:hypothetical protein